MVENNLVDPRNGHYRKTRGLSNSAPGCIPISTLFSPVASTKPLPGLQGSRPTSLLPAGLVVYRSHLSQEDPDPPAWPESSSPNAKLIGWPHCAARRSSPHRRGPLDTDEALSTACKAGARACRPVHILKRVGPRVPPGPPLRPPRVGEPRPVSHATARPWCDNDTVVTTTDTRVNVHLSLGS